MKTKISAVIIILFIGLCFSGCKKDFLELTPQGEMVYQNFFKTKTDALEALTGVYNMLGYEVNAVGVTGYDWVYGDIASDDASKGGENPADGPDIQEISNFTVNGGDDLLSEGYKYLYEGIFRANLVLLNVPTITDSSLTTGVKNRIIAEAQFLRAFYYFRMNIIWNGVPLVTTPLSSSQYKQPKATAAQIWAQIETDLKAAIPYLPHKNVAIASIGYDPSVDMGRATVGAAEALLAKTYIFEGKWSDAKTMCENIINSTEYDLETNYRNNFKYTDGFKNGIESVFEIQQGNGFKVNYDAPYNWANGDQGTGINIYQSPRGGDTKGFGGYGFNLPTVDLLNEFEPGDTRRKATVAMIGDTIDGLVFSRSIVYQNDTLAPVKYTIQRSHWAGEDCEGPSDLKIIRYADVLLWHAEACAHLGDPGNAAEADLKKIRNRAGLSDYPTDPRFTTDLLTAIYHERRVELGMEGHRFFDLVRTNRAATVLHGTAMQNVEGKSNFVAGKNEYFPLPSVEISLSGGALVQNPGY